MTTAQDVGKVSFTHRPPLLPGNTPGTHFCQRLSRPQGHSAIGRIMSLKNSSDTIGNRTRDPQVVAQCLNHYATARPRLRIQYQYNKHLSDGDVYSCSQWRAQECLQLQPVACTGMFIVVASGVHRNVFQGGGSTNSVEDRGSGGDCPLVRGSGDNCNLVQEISFHMVKFS